MAMGAVIVQRHDLDAAWRLLQRIYTQKEKSLPMIVFGTTLPPIPKYFEDLQHPYSMGLVDIINDAMVLATTYTIVTEWQFNPDQVDNLAQDDPRITALRQKLSNEIAKISLVADLRNQRVQKITQ